jgi:ankyrin repeat protein
MARLLIEKGAEIDARDIFDQTPLHTASHPVARLLIENGADTDVSEEYAHAPLDLSWMKVDLDGWDLHRAAKENRVDIARRITSLREIEDRDREARINEEWRIWGDQVFADAHSINRKAPEAYPPPTTLHTAAAYNSLRMARLLLNYGVEVNATDEEGDTPLHIAARKNYVGVTRLLIDHGANVNVTNKSELPESYFYPGTPEPEGLQGCTPLHWAYSQEVVRLLIENDADVDAIDSQGRTPLHIAAQNNWVDVARILIEKSADPNAAGTLGASDLYYQVLYGFTPYGVAEKTPLHIAVGNHSADVASLLLEHGADGFCDHLVVVDARDRIGQTPLHDAAAGESLDMTRLLIEHRADVNATDEEGDTPLHIAAAGESLDMTRLLIELGADINTRDKNGLTPLGRTGTNDSLDIARILIENIADLNAVHQDHNEVYPESPQMTEGWTHLHLAAHENSLDVARLLMEYGSDVDVSNNGHQTPLHIAAAYKLPDLARDLLNHGADVNARDKDGKTPLHHALYLEMAQMLISKGADKSGIDLNELLPEAEDVEEVDELP